MLDINHILVVLDPNDDEQHGLTRAAWLAHALEADITLLTHAWDSFGDKASQLADTTSTSIRDALIQRSQDWLDSYIDTEQLAELHVQTEVHWQKHLHDAAVESARATEFDLVVKSTHPHAFIDRIFSHSDWHLMRQCPAPVLMVKSANQWKHNRILACIDATSSDTGHNLINDNILSFAEHLADHFETDLHIANAYPMVAVALAMIPEVTPPDDIQKYVTEQHKEATRKWARKFNVHDDHTHLAEGDAEAVIPDLAQEIEADLIVVGTIGRDGLSGVLIGNTAEALLDKVSGDVLVIKPNDGVKPEVD